jgi:hypothetical protein
LGERMKKLLLCSPIQTSPKSPWTLPGWPDEFVKKSPKQSLDKINAWILLWIKVAPKLGLLLKSSKKSPK